MGQAFDRYGDVLGEATGATKREVFEKLNEAHKDAAEIRIKTLSDKVDDAAIQTDPIMRFFEFAHLPERLQVVSKPFCELAVHLIAAIPRNAERTVALRKLLESKDAAVRAQL